MTTDIGKLSDGEGAAPTRDLTAGATVAGGTGEPMVVMQGVHKLSLIHI